MQSSITQVMFHANDDNHTVVFWSNVEKVWCLQTVDGVLVRDINLPRLLLNMNLRVKPVNGLSSKTPDNWTVSLTG